MNLEGMKETFRHVDVAIVTDHLDDIISSVNVVSSDYCCHLLFWHCMRLYRRLIAHAEIKNIVVLGND